MIRVAMMFARQLRERVRRGRITCSVRIWTRPHVTVGGRYPMDEGYILVEAIDRIRLKDVTAALARESGFATARALFEVARHGTGRAVYLVRFHYVAPGGWGATAPTGARARRRSVDDSR